VYRPEVRLVFPRCLVLQRWPAGKPLSSLSLPADEVISSREVGKFVQRHER